MLLQPSVEGIVVSIVVMIVAILTVIVMMPMFDENYAPNWIAITESPIE